MLNYCANGPSGYTLSNSLRFRSSASAYLNRTPASAGNRQIFTVSTWVKRGTLGVDQKICSAYGGTNDDSGVFDLRFSSADVLYVGDWNTGLTTSAVFRDPSAWYHVVMAVDTTQATGSNRIKVYVNGVQQTLNGTAFVQNVTTPWNNSVQQNIGRNATLSNTYFDGYLAEFYNIDGQALTPSSFGSTNSTTGVWQPAKYTGTYGTNGFYLPFKNTASSGFSSYYGSFNGTNQYLNTTLPSTVSGQFTIEGWIRPNVVGFNPLFTLGDSNSTSGLEFYFGGGSTPTVWGNNASRISGSYNIPANTWAHVAITRDSSNVIRLFMNGIQIGGTWTYSTAFSSTVRIGVEYYAGSITSYMDGYISNFRIVTGSALYTSNFTPPSSAFTAISGTQLLTLQNATIIDNSTNALTITNNGSVTTTSATVGSYVAIGADYSGNNNTWFPNNINYTTAGTTYDSMTDVPTLTSATVANYPTLNPLSNTSTLTEANLSASNILLAGTTMATPNSGKWYFEYTQTTSIPSGSLWVGVSSNLNAVPDNQLQGYSYATDGRKCAYNSYTSGYGATWTNGDVIGCALDLDGGTITFYKNGVSQGTAFTGITVQPYVFALSAGGVASTKGGSINCGQRPFAYSVPSGYVALNTYNLPTSTIVQGNKYMDATLYTGNGSTQTITNAGGFKPDFIWIKKRDTSGQDHVLQDSNRGFGSATKLSSSSINNENDTGGGVTDPKWGYVTAANSNGFNITASTNGDQVNLNAGSYVAWQWQAGAGTTSSNTSGSTTSTVSVNASAGFSVVLWTGNGSNATVGHGLGVAPKMIILRPRNAAGGSDWAVYHANLTSAQYAVFLNKTNAQTSYPTIFNSTAPTSTVLSVGTGYNVNAANMLAYCFAEIAGFSKFGSWTGNANASGPFIYTGFQPKFIMFKRSDAIENWGIWTPLAGGNGIGSSNNFYLLPNSSGAQDTTQIIDILSNGFKIRDSGSFDNANNGTYIYAAFASNPFKNSNAF